MNTFLVNGVNEELIIKAKKTVHLAGTVDDRRRPSKRRKEHETSALSYGFIYDSLYSFLFGQTVLLFRELGFHVL
jgi:hypothetical protein